MPDIFSAQPGTVAVLGSNVALPLTVQMDGWDGAPNVKAILTQAAVHRAGRYQFLYTMRDFIYAYVFGEMLGNISVSGVLFSNVCNNNQQRTGFELVLEYYEERRFSRNGTPVTVTIGTTGFVAFLIDVKTSVEDPQLHLGSFTMQFVFPPRGINYASVPGSSPTTTPSTSTCCQYVLTTGPRTL